MNRSFIFVSAFMISLSFAGTALLEGADEESVSLFDGETLDGWLAADMAYWSVTDGAITASSTEESPCTKNQFLVWQGGEVDDFVLTLKFRIDGGPKANSGVQVRSKLLEDGHAVGYQVDIAQPDAPYLGAVYDEHGRKMLAQRGEKTVVRNSGELETEAIEGVHDKVMASYTPGEWAEYEIRFAGNRLEVRLNGITTAIVEDEQESEREMSGILALQLHSGPPMTVQFKDIVLTRL